MSQTLYFGNLAFSLKADRLKELIEEHAPVSEVLIPTDPRNGKIKGFAFAILATDSDTQKVIDAFDEKEIDGRVVTVEHARPPYLPPES